LTGGPDRATGANVDVCDDVDDDDDDYDDEAKESVYVMNPLWK